MQAGPNATVAGQPGGGGGGGGTSIEHALYRPAQNVHDWYEVGSMRSNTIGNPSIGTR